MAVLVNVLFALAALWAPALSATTAPAPIPATKEVIAVSVYFESYCPDSVKFLTKQLYPVYLSPLADNLNISLVPYGKAETNKSETGDYSFMCHHGEKECKGNKVISCVLREKSVPLAEKFKFINCTSSTIAANTKAEEYPVKECSTNALNYQEILNCAMSTEGSDYLAEYGNKTSELSPKLSSVPTVVFNDRYMEAESKMAIADFRKALCSKFSGTKPAECLRNSAAGLQATLLPLLAIFAALLRV